MSLLEQLRSLSPLLFENLSYDLLLLSGMKNLAWRTPGPDGGRDIEGDFLSVDFSGTLNLQHWYVECKRYATAVDWPTVFEKLSYAQNQGADYLLFCTTANLSPRCKEEVATHNARRARPLIRSWEGPLLETLISQQPLLLAKFGLRINAGTVGASILPIVHTLLKVNQAAYGSLSFAGETTPAYDLSITLTELIGDYLSRLEDPEDIPGSRFRPDRDLFGWSRVEAGEEHLSAFRSAVLRYAIAILHFMSPDAIVTIRSDGIGEAQLSPISTSTKVTLELVNLLSLYGNLDSTIDMDRLELRVR